MNYRDCIYGNVSIKEPVVIDIINCTSFQRLKDIDLGGYIEPYFPNATQSRFEHSIGVFLLLHKYGASLPEQIAGLIHDMSHSVFSHCIDYVLSEGSEEKHNHQDNIFETFITETEIPSILKKYGIDLSYVLNDKNFPLKERELPELCADRIEYALRCAVNFEEISIKEAKLILNHLKVKDQTWFFDDFSYAEQYAEIFLRLNTEYFASLLSAVMYRTVGDYLGYGLKKKFISKDDLYTTDPVILEKLFCFHKEDLCLQKLYNRMTRKTDCYNNPHDYEVVVKCKSRMVDPLCYHHANLIPISEIKSKWCNILKEESTPKTYYLKFDD